MRTSLSETVHMQSTKVNATSFVIKLAMTTRFLGLEILKNTEQTSLKPSI